MSSIAAGNTPISRYRPPPHRSLPPIPPRWAANERAFANPPLAHFVLLSILLHALAILLFGAPSGGSREGRAMWGALNVVISSPFVEPVPMLKIDRARLLPMLTPPKRTVVPDAAPKIVVPDAARAATVRDPVLKPEPLSIPPLLDRLIAPDRKLEMAPTFRVPPPRERPAPPQPQPPPPVEAPLPPPPAPAPVPRVERIPTEAPPVAAPLVQPIPPPPLPPAPPVERAPVETPALTTLTPTPPVERPPVEVPALPVPESAAPARIEPAARPVEKAPTPEVAPTTAPAPTAPSALERAIERAQEQQREPAPKSAEPLPGPLPRERETLPGPSLRERGNRGDFPTGRDRGDYDPTKPALDLDAIRNRAGQMAREGSGNRALLPFPMPPVAKPKSKLETAIEKARKPDCKEAYKDLGLAAIVPLIANEFGEGNCRW